MMMMMMVMMMVGHSRQLLNYYIFLLVLVCRIPLVIVMIRNLYTRTESREFNLGSVSCICSYQTIIDVDRDID